MAVNQFAKFANGNVSYRLGKHLSVPCLVFAFGVRLNFPEHLFVFVFVLVR